MLVLMALRLFLDCKIIGVYNVDLCAVAELFMNICDFPHYFNFIDITHQKKGLKSRITFCLCASIDYEGGVRLTGCCEACNFGVYKYKFFDYFSAHTHSHAIGSQYVLINIYS